MAKHETDRDAARDKSTASAFRVLISRLQRRLREQATAGEFTPSQVSVLRRLTDEGPMTVTALARAEGVRPQSMGATVSGLQEGGFIVGQPDPSDGRQTILRLTESCEEMIRANRIAREDWLLRTIESTFSPEEREELARAVELLTRIAEAQP